MSQVGKGKEGGDGEGGGGGGCRKPQALPLPPSPPPIHLYPSCVGNTRLLGNRSHMLDSTGRELRGSVNSSNVGSHPTFWPFCGAFRLTARMTRPPIPTPTRPQVH